MATLRVFTALPLPAEAVRRLAEACAALGLDFPNLRVVHPEGLHVTLQFFGELEGERAQEIAERLPAAIGAPPEVTRIATVVGGLGQFPPAGSPRVLYCPLGAGGEAVGALYARLRDALRPLTGGAGEEPGRAFQPHVTVARNKGGFIDLPAARERFAFEIPVQLDRVVLFQSILGRDGAEYRPLATAVFR